tara:strand:+ start:1753 stop:2598 length:846 start_codon:yes stop_codon:yes gene_type:complete
MIRIKGHSGCAIEIVDGVKSGWAIRKSSVDPSYVPRLQAQCEKQRSFIASGSISAPTVHSRKISIDTFSFDMAYFNGHDFLTFLEVCEKEDLDQATLSILDFLRKNTCESTWGAFPLDQFHKKIFETQDILRQRNDLDSIKIKECVDYLYEFRSRASFPFGYCHGDLTLSNILTSKEGAELVFIDFLDTFIDSPVQDYVKLRQDTQLYWSTMLYQGAADFTKMKIALEYMDNKIEEAADELGIRCFYEPFQILSLLRILKYTFDKKVINFIYNSIDKIIRN